MLPVYTNIRKLQLVSCQLSIIIIKMLNNDTRHTTSILLIRICCGVIRTVSVLESLVWCGQWTTIVGLIFVCRVSLLRTVITICKHFEIFVHPLLRKLRILWPVLLLVHDSITVTLCSTKCLTKTSTAANSESWSTNCLWSRSTATKCSTAMSQPALATCLL